MTRLRWIFRLTFAVSVALLGGAALAQQPPAATVGVDEVRREPLRQTVPVIGQLVARRAGTVAAQVDGAIQSFEVQVGDRLQQGDVIARLDDQILVARQAQIRAQRAQAQAALATAHAQLSLALQERDRLAKLKNTQATSRAQYDDAVKSAAIANARVREADAAIAVTDAQLRLADIDVAHASVFAPYAGVVLQRLTEIGNYVKTGDALLSMLADAELEVEADVPFDRLGGLSTGTSVVLTLDDNTAISAQVRAVIPDENQLTRTRAVRFAARFDEARQPLARGQSVTVQIPVGAPRDVVTVHKDAINRRGADTLVYVVVDETAKLRPVRLGKAVGNRVEVVKGLEPGELVVVRGNERLRPDDKVRVGQRS